MPQPTRTVTLGSVAVDSGTLLIIDPSYLEESWIPATQSQCFALILWGPDSRAALEALPLPPDLQITTHPRRKAFYLHHPDWDRADYTAFEDTLQAQAALHTWRLFTECQDGSTLQELYSAIDSSPHRRGATLPPQPSSSSDVSPTPAFPQPYRGGSLVGFQPGFGDGLYEVQATLVQDPHGGERIARITIECIPLDDDEASEAP